MPYSQAGRWPGWLLAAGATALLAIAGVTAWMLWPRPPAAPHARQYLTVSACLLTQDVVSCVTNPHLSSCVKAAVTVALVVATAGEGEVEVAAMEAAEEAGAGVA